MTYAPERADQRGARDVALAADDGRDGDHVIRIGGMAHAQKKTQRDDGKKADHGTNSIVSHTRNYAALSLSTIPGRGAEVETRH